MFMPKPEHEPEMYIDKTAFFDRLLEVDAKVASQLEADRRAFDNTVDHGKLDELRGVLRGLARARAELFDFPLSDVEKVRHGAWIIEDAGDGWKRAICPHCRTIFLYAKGHYQIGVAPRCPECGAKMDLRVD
ncbi:MAG: hypothetical protein IJS45_11450 [Clostridia bacterium]|nr:hypothetical protein [Clostridia bacterium]